MNGTMAGGAIALAVLAAALVLGGILGRIRMGTEEGRMSDGAKRGLTAAAVFAAVFWGSPFLIRYDGFYNVYVEGMRLIAAVLGAGLYWIGSRE